MIDAIRSEYAAVRARVMADPTNAAPADVQAYLALHEKLKVWESAAADARRLEAPAKADTQPPQKEPAQPRYRPGAVNQIVQGPDADSAITRPLASSNTVSRGQARIAAALGE